MKFKKGEDGHLEAVKPEEAKKALVQTSFVEDPSDQIEDDPHIALA